MHILIIPSWYPKKTNEITGSFFREQAIALSKHDNKIGIISPQLRSLKSMGSIFSGPYGMTSNLDEGMLTLRSHGMSWLPKIPYVSTWGWVNHGMKLFKNYRTECGDPDIIHAHCLFNGGLLAHAISEKYGIPYVVTEHSTAFTRGLIKSWQKRMALPVTLNAKSLFAVSEAFSEFLNSFFNNRVNWECMHNIVSSRFENYCHSSNHNNSDIFTFCNISTLDHKKGLDVLIQAFAKSFSKMKQIKLKIAGSGHLRNKLIRLTDELNISDQVEFVGTLSRDAVVNMIADSNSYVLSSRFETFGVVLIESLTLGKPVIATRCGGPESIIRPQDGFIVEKNNIPALSDAISRMYTNYNSFDFSEIRKSSIERFGEITITNKLINRYNKILSGI